MYFYMFLHRTQPIVVHDCVKPNGICVLFVFTQHYVIFAEIALNANIYSFDFNDLWVIN